MSRKYLTPLQLPADPVNPLEAVTKQYADGLVVIAAADPIAANPSCELWVDTATPAQSATSMPRGWVGEAVGIAVSGIAANTWVALNISVTWTADPTRRYKTSLITGGCHNLNAGASNNGNASIQNAAAAILVQPTGTIAAGGFWTYQGWVTESGLSGTQVRSGWVYGQFSIDVQAGSRILVEDIGGV